MTWYGWVERRRTLLIGGMSIIGFLALLVCARRNIISADSFWHLQMGKDWVENGLSPWIDHYSFTFGGAGIESPPVLFQATLHWFVAQFGLEFGYELLKFACYALALVMVLLYLRQIRANVCAYLVVLPLVFALVELRGLMRPELISYSLSVAALMLYHRAGTDVSARTVIPIALLMWFWSNYHTPVVAYVIFFGFFVDAGVHLLRERSPASRWIQWFLWGLLVLAVGAIRPGFTHPLYETLSMSPEWRLLIQEYESPLLYKGVAAFYALIAVTLLTLYLSARQRRIGYLAIILVLVFGASTMVRLVTPAGIVIACLFAHVMTESDFRSWLRRSSPIVERAVGACTLALVLASLWTVVDLARDYMEENKRSDVLFPSDVVQHMKHNGRSGNIFNEYQIGGYLIHSLSPDSKVYIDGRTNMLYPVEHYKRLLRAKRSPEILREELDTYDISLAVVHSSPANYFLMNEVGLGLDFVGAAYSLFVRDEPNFPVLGKLLARPACWDDSLVGELEAEQTTAALFLLPNSLLWPFLRLVGGYSQAAEQAQYLQGLDSVEGWTDSGLRFAAYRALRHDLNALGINFLNAVGKREMKDPLAAAFGMIRLGDLDNAEDTLRVASETVWPYLESAELVIMYGLLRKIEEQRPASTISPGFRDYLDGHMEDAGLLGKQYEVTVELFCPKEGWISGLQR